MSGFHSGRVCVCVDTHTGPELNSSQKLLQKSAVVGKLTVCVFSPVYEVQSANSTLFISLCIVYSNIGHRAHKSSPGCAKTAPFVCTVLTDSILCPLTSSPQLSLSPSPSVSLSPSLSPLICSSLSPGNTWNDPCFSFRLLRKKKLDFCE